MAETAAKMEESDTSPKHEASSGDKDEHDTSYESNPEYPAGGLKSEASGGEVMSLKDCCRDAFAKITEYLNGELAGKQNPSIQKCSNDTKCTVSVARNMWLLKKTF